MARPFVFVNMAMTADGKITSATREYPHFTSPYDRRMMSTLRAQADAVIIGAGTLRADDPPLHIRESEALEARKRAGKPAEISHVVVSRTLDIALSSSFFKNPAARRIVATCESAPADRVASLEGKAEVWKCGQDRVDLPLLLERLASIGIKRLLLEGGAELNWQFCEADLMDELHITIGAALLGGVTAPTPIGGPGLRMAGQRRLKLLSVTPVEDELYCHYAVQR